MTNRHWHSLVAGVGLVGLTACSSAATLGQPTAPVPHSRPAAKAYCPVGALPASIARTVTRTEHALVPLGTDLLGSDDVYEGRSGVRLEVLDGGYVDDITENYDDLRVDRSVRAGDAVGQVLVGSFQGRPVVLTWWRRSGDAGPCAVQGVVANGLTADQVAALAEEMM